MAIHYETVRNKNYIKYLCWTYSSSLGHFDY